MIAESPEQAMRAAAEVKIDYKDLPPILTIEVYVVLFISLFLYDEYIYCIQGYFYSFSPSNILHCLKFFYNSCVSI